MLARDSQARFAQNLIVRAWSVRRDPKTDVVVHTLQPGFGNALIAPPLSQVFQVLRITAVVWGRGEHWLLLHEEPSLNLFESEHGADKERHDYNARCLARVLTHKRRVRGEHAGYHDLFVPVIVGGEVAAVLVTGPFAMARATSTSVLANWRALTGRKGHPRDPEFASYLSAALSTLVLDDGKARRFERLLTCLARLMAGDGRAVELCNEIEVLRVELEAVRKVEHTWKAVEEMVDERSPRKWHSVRKAGDLARFGLSRVPDAVLVALTSSRSEGADVQDAIARDGFQREAVQLAARTGEIIAGRVGDHGVVFLSSAATRKVQRLTEFADKASVVARREFGLALHFGTAQTAPAFPLSRAYQSAIAVADSALVRGVKFLSAEDSNGDASMSLWHLRQELGRAIERPDALKARFDRFLEAVAVRSGYRMDLAVADLQVGFECVAEPLVAGSVIDARAFHALREDLDRGTREAGSMHDLFAAYRRAIAELSDALTSPVLARHDRSVRGALDYIRRHFTERLSLARVAREVGVTPNYFSRIFRQREQVTFERYVLRLRLERAKQLLSSTQIDVARVAELSGFNSAQYFCHAFRRALGMAPLEYRRAPVRLVGVRARHPRPRSA
jgi:AraC-like DNA-binding protein